MLVISPFPKSISIASEIVLLTLDDETLNSDFTKFIASSETELLITLFEILTLDPAKPYRPIFDE